MGTVTMHQWVTSKRKRVGRGLVVRAKGAENRMGGGICQGGVVIAGRSGHGQRGSL
jgi:hypothetical protein